VKLLKKYTEHHKFSWECGSNGWWAIRWTTQSWHDAIFADITWRFKEAKLVRRKFGGSYPSTHFPLLATYCAQSETLLTTGNHSGF
jgi:hypothetical protein